MLMQIYLFYIDGTYKNVSLKLLFGVRLCGTFFSYCVLQIFLVEQMMEYFNKKANLTGSPALGSFISAFSLTGAKSFDAAAIKSLSVDGFFVPLAKLELSRPTLMLQENIRKSIPVFWDPPSLSR